MYIHISYPHIEVARVESPTLYDSITMYVHYMCVSTSILTMTRYVFIYTRIY